MLDQKEENLRMVAYFRSQRIGFALVTLLFLILLSSTAYCDISKDEIPKIIKSGLSAYKSNGPEAAIAEWIKGSPFEGSKDAMSQANLFKQVETYYGKYMDYQPIAVIKLTPTTKIVYLSMNYETGPVFCKFLIYKTQDSWILSGKFNFHTEPEQVLPEGLLDIKK